MSPRQHLLERSLKYFLKHGVANLSLRPLAAFAGTSARMLVHHFGSKEELITAVMREAHARLQDSLQTMAKPDRHRAAAIVLEDFWRLISSPSNLPYMRLLFEVQVLAIQNPRRYARYLATTSSSWLRLINRALPSGKDGAVIATLFIAVIDGLMLELLSTGDVSRTTKALCLFAKKVTNSSR